MAAASNIYLSQEAQREDRPSGQQLHLSSQEVTKTHGGILSAGVEREAVVIWDSPERRCSVAGDFATGGCLRNKTCSLEERGHN